MDKSKALNKLVLQPSYMQSLSAIRKLNLTITQSSKIEDFNLSSSEFPQHGNIKLIEDLQSVNLDPINGQNIASEYLYSAYDESKFKYSALEGCAYFTSHTIVTTNKKEYIPVTYLSFYFYTRSKDITHLSPYFRYAEDPEIASNYDYLEDRGSIITNWIQDNSIALIDGPLIGGNLSSYTISLVDQLHKKNVIPIFCVKNSDSNLLTNYIPQLKSKFNSDMHWSYNFLKVGQRTSCVLYIDEHNPRNAKVFCYLKAFNVSPQRIEFHVDTFSSYKDKINDILNMVYYLILVQGDRKNPQVRPIAIAEKYSREVLKATNSYYLIKSSGLVPTMNQERFGS